MGPILAWHKKHALVIAGQLPENPQDVRAIMRAVQVLVDDFLEAELESQENDATNVLPFGVARG